MTEESKINITPTHAHTATHKPDNQVENCPVTAAAVRISPREGVDRKSTKCQLCDLSLTKVNANLENSKKGPLGKGCDHPGLLWAWS